MQPLILCAFLAHVAIAPAVGAVLTARVLPLSQQQPLQPAPTQRTSAESAAMARERGGPVCSLRIMDAGPGLDPGLVRQLRENVDARIVLPPSCRPEEPARR